jgi:hypothetical protein
MSLILDGTNGLSDIDGTAATPAIRGTDTNTGIFFPAADTIAFSEGGVESMRINASGQVGIGTNNPNQLLDVRGSSSPTIKVRNDSSTTGVFSQLLFEGGNSFSGTSTSYIQSIVLNGGNSSTALAFGTNADGGGAATERMRIGSSGNVGIGGAPNGRLHVIDEVDRTETTAQFMIGGNGYTAFHWLNGTAYYIGQNSDARSLRIYSGSNENTGVNLGVGGTSWGTYSDERLKDIIEPITNGVEKLSNLRTVIGKYKTDNADKRRVFLIAQDVEKVLPEATYKDNEDTLFLQYQDLIPVLVKAIQEQQAMFTELKATVDAQAARIAALEAAV